MHRLATQKTGANFVTFIMHVTGMSILFRKIGTTMFTYHIIRNVEAITKDPVMDIENLLNTTPEVIMAVTVIVTKTIETSTIRINVAMMTIGASMTIILAKERRTKITEKTKSGSC